jgi:hypothetical protein
MSPSVRILNHNNWNRRNSMFNERICRDCDKLGNCNMKCAALKRLEIPCFLIHRRDRGRGSVAEYERELLKQLERSKMGLICPDDAEVIVSPYRSAGAAIAFDVCGRGQVLRDIVKIKQTDDELIFIDSEGRENHVAKKLIDVMEVIT